MTRNKILSAAIASALSMGSGLAYAAAGTFTGPTSGGTCIGTKIPAAETKTKVALELFDPSKTAEITIPSASGNYCFKYTLAETDDVDKDFNVTFTLENANFTSPDPAFSTDMANAPVIQQQLQAAGTNTVTFEVRASDTDLTKTSAFTLQNFDIDVVENVFATAGAKATLTIGFTEGVGDTQTKTLLESTTGTTVTFKKNTDTPGPAIDVAESSLKFTPTSTGDDKPERASIGTVAVTNSATTVYGKDMSTAWTVGAGTGASLTITSGPFSSLDADAKVFIGSADCNPDSATAIIEPATMTGDQATFSTTTAALSSARPICIVVPEDNTVRIDETDEAPKATLRISHTDATITSAAATLTHLKNNGAVCTVYNVTDDLRTDFSYVRITNMGSTSATVRGTLVGMDGKTVFENVDLGAEMSLPDGKLAPYATLVLNSNPTGGNQLVEIAKNYPPTTGEYANWKRGVFTLTSTADKGALDVLLLLQAGMGAPQMNMSYGGSLGGCD